MTMRAWMRAGLAGCLIVGGSRISAQTAGAASQVKPAEAAQASDSAPNADPALWVVKGPHETVYLFGTVHVMKPDVHWQTKKVMDAFNASGTLYLEVAKPDDMAAVQPLVMQMGMDQAHPLSTKISPADVGALDKIVKDLGMPGEQMLEPMQPWLAYMTLSVLPMMRSGYGPASGVDVTLLKMARDKNKEIVGFETMEQQLHYFADFPQAEQVALLHDVLSDMPNSVKQTNEIIADWQKGNVDGIAAKENAAVVKTPALYKKLVVDRNARFADDLAKVLREDKPGVVFVAIGAAHLAGPDSVQKDLEAKGFKVTRQ